ncbi:TPA: hypothetical protein OZI11_002770 [Staphylococcus aureus]|nr:hypothetical protein [Staphylococcus aureus]
MKININFEKQSPEEKAKKKAAKKAKRQEKYGHLTKAQEGSLADFIGQKVKENSKNRKKLFDDNPRDTSYLKNKKEGSLAAYLSNLKNEMFPKDPDKDDKS